MNIEESSMTQTIEESRYLLKHMHISDNNRKMPGLGHINFGEIINSLKRINFGGFLSFEPYIFSKDYQKDIFVRYRHSYEIQIERLYWNSLS